MPQVVFYDVSRQEINAIIKAKKQLEDNLFYLEASIDLNVIKKYLFQYPNTTFKIGMDQHYNDEGYETIISVSATSTDEQEEDKLEIEDIGYELSEELTESVWEKVEGISINNQNFDHEALKLLPKAIYEQWKLGKIGLEKKRLEEYISQVCNPEVKSHKL